MIKSIELYLVTNNNGMEAVQFYKDCLGAEVVSLTTFGDAIPSTPENAKNLVLNAQLNVNGIRLMLSDNGFENEYILGNNVTACLQIENIESSKDIFEKLSKDAQKVEMPIQETPWSPAYGIVVDKFGVSWQVNTDIPGYVSENVKF